ncbi:kinase [Streptomyces sp. CMSTAAHL-2]|uniref:GHMP family kinase ATP-binding protein n=1 Tax=Streptomyces TaxID=1883 RepID=UPI001E3C0472|nr:kinase [Streptomyces sp. CMSTAAHL-2]MCE3034977.1 kinase [Streptomyces sp. CMSTAAHL-2]
MPPSPISSPAAAPADLEPGLGHAFGTFGELLQGALPEPDGDFLVTFPLARWATAAFHPWPGRPDVRVAPAHKAKSRRTAEAVLSALGVTHGGLLELGGDLPEGKGMASSSADLVATVRAVGAAFGRSFSPAETEAFLRGVEPADGVMYDEIVCFHHRGVRLGRRLGTLPPFAVVAHDEGGQVDTVAHNRTAGPIGAADRHEYARLLDRLTAAVTEGDLPAVGEVATRSAELNGRRRERPGFDRLRVLCDEVGGLGLVLAHSGTLLGVLLEAGDPELDAKSAHIRAGCAGLGGEVSVHRSLGAGDDWTRPHRGQPTGPAGPVPRPAVSPPAVPHPAAEPSALPHELEI